MKKNKKNKKSKMSGGEKTAIGAGVAALSAGAYYLLGPKSKMHQKKMRALMVKMKTEVSGEIKKAKKITTPLYHKAIDAVAANYVKQYKMHEKDIKILAQKLKSEWKKIK